MNRLSEERSAYLRHAAYQKIDWYPWSEEAFLKARDLDRPIFLSSGAVWCHWCHVMAKESFEDEETVRLLNDNFINIKLDRDERPDIDRRYQLTVAAMGSAGGWPLSVFLKPDKRPFFGGTYFPPGDKFGKPGFKKVLKAIIAHYQSNREEITEYTEKLMAALIPDPLLQGEMNETLVDNAVKNILSGFDPQNGGFGTAPKFPMPGAMEFLINRYFFSKEEPIGYAVRKTLEAMAKGGVHDQLGGGFHRYSVDEAWIVPHFEKMATDNAGLLGNYVDAYSVFGDELFRETASGIIKFLDTVLADSEGGFYSSQDADVTPDDEGGYFTWTEEELKNTLTDMEFKVISMHLLSERGKMHHDDRKMVLSLAAGPEEIAQKTGLGIQELFNIIRTGKQKLLDKRKKRREPFIDKTLYTSINGMLISSYIKAYRVFKNRELKDFALKSIDRILNLYYIDGELFHSEKVRGMLDDYVYLVGALIDVYEVTGDTAYIEKADEIMQLCINNLWDNDSGGFFDTDNEVMGLRLKGIEDVPHPSANAVGTYSLLKLYQITSNDRYFEYAEKSLRLFSNTAKGFGIHSASYFLAHDAYFNMLRLTVEAEPGAEISNAALFTIRPYKTLVYGKKNNHRVVPCIRDKCYQPVQESEALKKFIRNRLNG